MERTTLQLQQVTCPSCKRPINTFNPNKLMAECPYCHSKLVNPLVKPKNVIMPNRIIPFTTSEQDFEKAMVEALANQDFVPTDIFEAIHTGSVIQTYLPMYLFEGTYNATWNCESAYTENKQTKWRSRNGIESGNFAFLCLANEGEEIPEELRDFTRLFPYDVMMSKEFNPDMIDYNDDNLMTLERNTDATIVWQKYGKGLVEELAQKAAIVQVGNQDIRNFRVSSNHQLTTRGEYVLVPFWFVYYNYDGKQYHFLMDGIGQRTCYSHPVDEKEAKFVDGKETVKKIVKWLWVLALVFAALVNMTAAVGYLVIWFIAKIIVNRMMNGQIQDQLDNSKNLRLAAARNL